MLMDKLAWEKRDFFSELSKHWPMKRNRWFCVMTNPSWLEFMGDIGNDEQTEWKIKHVLERFYKDDEIDSSQLRLNDFEYSCYQDQRLGSDVREVTTDMVCATVLHSYGSALSRCPCLCRSSGFAFTSLIQRGLRGFYVIGEKGARYLSHRELATLLGIGRDMKFGEDEKQNLCLLGLVASPIQVIIVVGNLLYAAAHTAHNLQRIHPRTLIDYYRQQVIQQHQDTLGRARQTPPTSKQDTITTHSIDDGQEATYWLQTKDEITAAQVISAERINKEWGAIIKVHTGERLHEPNTAAHGTIHIERAAKRSRTETPTGKVALIIKHDCTKEVILGNKGDFLFQFLNQGEINAQYVTDEQGTPFPIDERIWHPGTFQTVEQHTFPKLPSLTAKLTAAGLHGVPSNATMGVQGLTDKTIDENAITLMHAAGLSSKQYWPPRMALYIIEANTNSATAFIQEHWPSSMPLYGVLWDEGHWISFKAQTSNKQMKVNIFDGLKRAPIDYIEYLFYRAKVALKCDELQISVQATITQTFGTHCGTIALLHLREAIGLPGEMTELAAYNWHRQVADIHQQDTDSYTPSTTISITLRGEGADSTTKLRDRLQDKGVPAKMAQQRAENVTAKLGQHTIDRVLQDKNPWGALKQAASKPGIMLKLLTDQERQNYIEERAQTKHGAQIKQHKSKKQQGKGNGKGALTLQPEQLEIDPKHFQDPKGQPVPQISFEAVGAEQTGIAICTADMAAPFIAQAKSISTAPLGLLLVDLPPQEHIDKAGIRRLRFPAKYISTQEHILVFGGIMDLGIKPSQGYCKALPQSQTQSKPTYSVFKPTETSCKWHGGSSYNHQ